MLKRLLKVLVLIISAPFVVVSVAFAILLIPIIYILKGGDELDILEDVITFVPDLVEKIIFKKMFRGV